MENNFYTYKGYPLVRCKDTIYYGFMSEPFVIMMQILSTKKQGEYELCDKIKVYKMSTDPSLNPIEAIVNTAERNSLYEAIDLAEAWLERA